MNPGIADAFHQLSRHRGVLRVGEPLIRRGSTEIEIDVAVALPSRSRHSGQSATGVRVVETCTLVFGNQWPLRAPRPFLRADFPLDLPHLNMHTPGALVSPCVFEGDLDELLHRFGLDAIVDQLILWLDGAAGNTLIDLSQGWEPTRRDSCPSTIVFSAEKIIAATPTDGSIAAFGADYVIADKRLHGILNDPLAPIAAPVFSQHLQNDGNGKWARGKTVAFVAQAPHQDGQPVVVGQYQPETVVDLEPLLIRATALGIDRAALARSLDSYYSRSVFDVAQDPLTWQHGLLAIVILVVARPACLVGSPGRSAEVLPFVVRYDCLQESPLERHTSAHPAFHAHALSPQLLQLTSGMGSAETTQPWVMLGCGSLGSKIALHLGKAGFGAATFVDGELMSPHNLARHGLLGPVSVLVRPQKAALMQTAFQALSHEHTRAHGVDAAQVLQESDRFDQVVPKDAVLIIDTTASLRLLATQSQSAALNASAARLARVVMYGQGRCAVVALEGMGRVSRVDDLTALVFEKCRNDPVLRSAIAGDSTDPARVFVGDNCRSLTFPMSDATVSRAAALAGVQLERWLTKGLPAGGVLGIGVLDASRIGMDWSSHAIGPTTMLDAQGAGGWHIRVLHSVTQLIDQEAAHWGPNETGGALIGRISYETRTITIAGVVAAPPDSIRERARFILGKQGLISSLRQAHAHSMGYLTFIGTWHTHPQGGSHSSIDMKTLRGIAEDAGGIPAVSLVWTPEGLTCAVDRW